MKLFKVISPIGQQTIMSKKLWFPVVAPVYRGIESLLAPAWDWTLNPMPPITQAGNLATVPLSLVLCHWVWYSDMESSTAPLSLVGVMADREVQWGPLDECLHCTMKLYTRYSTYARWQRAVLQQVVVYSMVYGSCTSHLYGDTSALSPRQLAHRLVHQLANITHQDNIPKSLYVHCKCSSLIKSNVPGNLDSDW